MAEDPPATPPAPTPAKTASSKAKAKTETVAPKASVNMSILIETTSPDGKKEVHTEPFGKTEAETVTGAHALMAPHLAVIISYRNSLHRQGPT